MSDSNGKWPDTADIVEIEIHPIKLQFSNQNYPHPTRKDIIVSAREYLEANTFSYSEKRITHNDKEHEKEFTTNKEPISSTLETFGDIQDALDNKSFGIHNELVSGELQKDIAKSQTIGRSSTEQGGSRLNNAYNIDHDPLNEE